MKVHLLKSAEVDTTLFTKVVDFLQSIPGAIQFYYDLKKNSLVEINNYYGDKYAEHSEIMKIIIFTLVPVIIITLLIFNLKIKTY